MRVIIGCALFICVTAGCLPRIVEYDRANKVVWHNTSTYYPEIDPQTKGINELLSLGTDTLLATAIGLISTALLMKRR